MKHEQTYPQYRDEMRALKLSDPLKFELELSRIHKSRKSLKTPLNDPAALKYLKERKAEKLAEDSREK